MASSSRVVPVLHRYSPRTPVLAPGPDGTGRTQQQFREEVDINEIMRRATRGQMPTHLMPGTPLYGDFSGPSELQDMLDSVAAADQAFLELPAEARELADNDPVRFLELVDEGDEDLLRSVGVVLGPPQGEPPAGPPEGGGAAAGGAPGAAEAPPSPAGEGGESAA